jgi:TonB family protein
MKLVIATFVFLAFCYIGHAQSGRRVKRPQPVTIDEQKQAESTPRVSAPSTPSVTAEINEDYRCTNDGTLAHVLDDSETVKAYAGKEVDTKATIVNRPEPKYTREARRAGVQGYVIVKVLLSANGQIDRVRVVRPLPWGLTESAIRAACDIRFKPAIKDRQTVPQWITVEYAFRLTRSSIYGWTTVSNND